MLPTFTVIAVVADLFSNENMKQGPHSVALLSDVPNKAHLQVPQCADVVPCFHCCLLLVQNLPLMVLGCARFFLLWE